MFNGFHKPPASIMLARRRHKTVTEGLPQGALRAIIGIIEASDW
jgi:hypothetical protein